MKITIKEYLIKDHLFIYFETDVGEGAGVLKTNSNEEKIEVNQIYDVEMDFNCVFTWNKDMHRLMNSTQEQIAVKDNTLTFIGEIVAYEDKENLLVINLNGTIIMLEVFNFSGLAKGKIEGSLSIHNVSIYLIDT